MSSAALIADLHECTVLDRTRLRNRNKDETSSCGAAVLETMSYPICTIC